MKSQWSGQVPKTCELCGKELHGSFADARTTRGYWAIMCSSCFQQNGEGLGLGQGQMYDHTTKQKIAG